MANTKNMTVFRGRDTETHGQKHIAGATAAITLSVEEAMYGVIELTGAITADKTISFPAVDGLRWTVINNTTGAFNVSVKLQGGATSVAVAQGANQVIFSTGAELVPVSGAGSQAAASSSPSDLLGSPTPVSWTVVNIGSGTAAVTLNDAQGSAGFLEFHNAHVGGSTVSFPALKGHPWVVKNAADSVGNILCSAAGAPGTAVDVEPGFVGFLVVDDSATMQQLLVAHGNTHAAGPDTGGGQGTDAITSLLSASALGSGTPSASNFLRGDRTWGALNRGAQILLCAGFTAVATGADAAEVIIPFDPADGTSVLTWNVRRIWLRVGTAGGAPVAVVQKSTVGNAAFGAGTTVGTLTMPSGDSEVAVTSSLGTIQSGNKVRFSVTTLGTALNWSIGMEIGL